MDKNQFQDLLKTIKEAYDPHSDPRNAFFPMDKLQPWERLIGGDIHDIPGGKEAWEKQQAEKAAKSAKPAEKKKLTASNEGDIFSHIESNAFSMDDAAHAKAKEMVAGLKNSLTSQYPSRLESIHAHLAAAGVDENHPHMKALLKHADEAEQMNYEKARSRAGL
jgi:hypothetical protein